MKTYERSIFGFGRKSKEPEEKPKEELVASNVLEEEPIVMSDEELMKIRDKSRLPQHIKSEISGENIPQMTYLWQFSRHCVRKRYATYGKASGLKPGVMWPSKEEFDYIKGIETTFYPPLNEMVAKRKAIREEELIVKQKREKEIMTNLKQLPKWKKEFWNKYHKMHDDIEAEKLKKEKLIQEVREFVGYDLDPKDPRFEEALIKRDEEMKKLSKAARKQEKQRITLERLQALAAEAMEREKDDESILEKSKTQKQKEEQTVDSNQSESSGDSQKK
jgi:hypothetical protein